MANPRDLENTPLSVPDAARWGQAFPTLSPEHLAALESFGETRKFKKGEEVWHVGVTNLCMFVVVEGELEIQDPRSHTRIAVHRKGQFSGDIDLLTGRPTIVQAVAATDLELLQVGGECVRNIVAVSPALGEILLKAFLMRRMILQENHIGTLIIGSRYSPDTLRIREFLSRNRLPFEWQDLEDSAATGQLLEEFKVTADQTPVVVLPNGAVLKTPSNAELGEQLGFKRSAEDKVYDLVIVGAGPSGLAAAVYGASEGLSTLIVDTIGPGGQAGTSSRIENYMGFPLGLTGQDLADRATAQAEKFGAQFMVSSCVTNVKCNGHEDHELTLDTAGAIRSRCIILALGAAYRRLELDNLSEFEGRGVFYSATHVERMLCTDKSIVVVGAGNSAGQAAMFMCEQTAHVFLVVRGSDLRRTMSNYLAVRIERNENITVLVNSEICAMYGDEYLSSVTIVDKSNGKRRKEDVSGVFVMIGAVPPTEWLPPAIARDSKGFILTGQRLVQEEKWGLSRPPFYLETSCPGVFAVGDARADSVKRVASAVGEGSMAVAFVHQFLAPP